MTAAVGFVYTKESTEHTDMSRHYTLVCFFILSETIAAGLSSLGIARGCCCAAPRYPRFYSGRKSYCVHVDTSMR
jgi:hypothetical protein